MPRGPPQHAYAPQPGFKGAQWAETRRNGAVRRTDLGVRRTLRWRAPLDAPPRSLILRTLHSSSAEQTAQQLPPGVAPAPIATHPGPRPPGAPHAHMQAPPGAAYGMHMRPMQPGAGMGAPHGHYGGPQHGMMGAPPMGPPHGYAAGPPGAHMWPQYGGGYGMAQPPFAGQMAYGGGRCVDVLCLRVCSLAPCPRALRPSLRRALALRSSPHLRDSRAHPFPPPSRPPYPGAPPAAHTQPAAPPPAPPAQPAAEPARRARPDVSLGNLAMGMDMGGSRRRGEEEARGEGGRRGVRARVFFHQPPLFSLPPRRRPPPPGRRPRPGPRPRPRAAPPQPQPVAGAVEAALRGKSPPPLPPLFLPCVSPRLPCLCFMFLTRV